MNVAENRKLAAHQIIIIESAILEGKVAKTESEHSGERNSVNLVIIKIITLIINVRLVE